MTQSQPRKENLDQHLSRLAQYDIQTALEVEHLARSVSFWSFLQGVLLGVVTTSVVWAVWL